MCVRYSTGCENDWLQWEQVRFFPPVIPLQWCTSSCSRFVNALKHWLHLQVKSSAGSKRADARVCCLYPKPRPRYEVVLLSSVNITWSCSDLLVSVDSVLLKGGRPLWAGACSVRVLLAAGSTVSFLSALVRDLSWATRSRGGCTPVGRQQSYHHMLCVNLDSDRYAWSDLKVNILLPRHFLNL